MCVCVCLKLTNLNDFLTREVTDGRKSCSVSIKISEGLLDCH